ncbi:MULTISPECIES: beta-lactamase hydrolase domain-containing protein [Bacteria]|uniref:Beta-lactamase hydrolase-like protein phosphatase-like domain-containing protein n=1 Tax=Tsuneonella aeria TaxID=1837929 RepID=A0A6I4TIN2_9SPHN|nr:MULTISPECIES: sulfur transferase domain-containing protein [Bacteria]MXO75900.1 hypothetical protein [Tsuneonella aeria]TCJ40823.1 hypothetical protein E0504_02575 [Parafrankia sp. BMG5.11]
MDGLIELDERLHIFTRPPNEADVRDLSRAGMRSVVNLRAPGEAGEVLAPDTEGEEANRSGLAYRSFPVTPSDLNAGTASIISAELEQLPAPIAIHCASGKRASLMALADWAYRHDASASKAAAKAQAAGLKFSEADLQPLIERGARS